MGQYYLTVNIDKKQYLNPHAFGDGLKLLEFACSGRGTMMALGVLLADGNNRGGGDLHSDAPAIGSWAGDRIVVAGDYADGGSFVDAPVEELTQIAKDHYTVGHQDPKNVTLYALASETYEDISAKIMAVLMEDSWIRGDLEEAAAKTYEGSPFEKAYAEARELYKAGQGEEEKESSK